MLLSVQDVAAKGAQLRPDFKISWRPALAAYAAHYSLAAKATAHVQPCMLAAIVCRETGGQNILQIGIPPGPGCGVGLTQITSGVDWSVSSTPSYPGYGPLLDAQTNLRVCATEFLEPLLDMFPDNHLAAFAAYNVGAGNVQAELKDGLSPDAWTTGHDYGTAVFESWINFTAASCGDNADWANYKP
jgi:hypothetical protein